MKLSKFRWAAVFLNLSSWFALLFSLTGAVVRGFAIPLYGWLVFDLWQWEPLGRSLRFVLLGATGGVVAGAFFTNYEWLLQTHATTLRKIITTALVVATCIFVVVMAREHAGRLLPG